MWSEFSVGQGSRLNACRTTLRSFLQALSGGKETRWTWVQVLFLPLLGCVTLGHILHHCESLHCHLPSGNNGCLLAILDAVRTKGGNVCHNLITPSPTEKSIIDKWMEKISYICLWVGKMNAVKMAILKMACSQDNSHENYNIILCRSRKNLKIHLETQYLG